MTYWPFAYSEPFTISFESTGTLSFGQMYGLFRAVMHVACSVVKERSFVSVAPYSLTGMFTRPNAIAPLHKARAIVGPPEEFKRRAMRLLTICPPRLCGHFGRLVHPGVRFNQGPESSTHRRLRACRDDGREREH